MTRLIFVRHGQTTYNVSHTYCGQLDCSLTEQGYNQAEELKNYILSHGIHIDAIWSSDLQRARATVAPIASELSLPLHLHAALREINVGDFTDQPNELIKELYPEIIAKLSAFSHDACYPNGESLYEVRQRVYSAACEIAEKNADKTVLIASHAGAIRGLIRECHERLGQKEPYSLSIKNVSLSFFDYDAAMLIPKETGVHTCPSTISSDTENKKEKDITVI